MTKLWQKNWQLDSFIETFETGDDLACDQKLVDFDVYGSIAHARMLVKIGILKELEYKKLKQGLVAILALHAQGKFTLRPGDEDVHTKIENYLTNKYGAVGKKIHTGRSRNDQVLTALRLLTKASLLGIWRELLELNASFIKFAGKYEWLAMPGYTHMQIAMPSSVGMWAAAFGEALLDSLAGLEGAYNLNDQSPLGSAAGYGIPLDLDREYTAKLLGFAKVQTNPIYCQNSRGKIEGLVVAALLAIGQDINKFASDVLLFTTSEFNYFKVADKLCSGSSIMPQKKNIDVAELLRSKAHLLLGHYVQIVSGSSNLISGYNRDLQDGKKPFLESLAITQTIIQAASILINNLEPNEENLKLGLKPEIFATHQALEMVKKGMPWRQAYNAVGSNLSSLTGLEPLAVLKSSRHSGATGNLGLAKLRRQLAGAGKIYRKQNTIYQTAINNLLINQ